MKNHFRTILSAALSFVILFLLSVQPHSAVAAPENPNIVEQSQIEKTKPGSPVTTDNVSSAVEPEVLPLVLAPIAAAGFTWTIIDSIFAASLGLYVGSQTQDLFKSTVNDKQTSSSAQYQLSFSPTVYQSYPISPVSQLLRLPRNIWKKQS